MNGRGLAFLVHGKDARHLALTGVERAARRDGVGAAEGKEPRG
ncbi:MAG: hypothetical protein ACRESR_05615 [Gammaproteobacteria bacterium]